MKSFLKTVFANIVAIFIVFFTVAFFFVIFLLMASLSGSDTVKIRKNSVLTLDFRTNIIDSPSEDETGSSIFTAFNDKTKNVVLYDVVQAIKAAEKDDNIKGISLETDNISAGITQLDDLRTALQNFKKTGKFVLAYGNVMSQAAYYLGSVADQFYLNPAGGLDLKGLSAEVMYYKGFTDKYGIGVDVIRHGKYKSAVEPFIREDMSPENREQLSAILNDIWQNISTKMSVSRKMSNADFKTVTDSLYGMIPGSALKYRLTDKLIQKSEYDDILRSKLKLAAGKKINKVSFTGYIHSMDGGASSSNRIAVLYASGAISNGEGYDGIHSKNYIDEIRKLAADDEVKAVVFRINSPGGSANASDEILFELQKLKQKKPLVVSFGDYAASGGYYIAMAADKIYSEPNTLTGSIGVFGLVYNFKDLAHKNGLNSEAVKTNENSNFYSPINGLSDGAKIMMTKSVEQTYKRFVHFVTVNRKKSFEQIDAVGGGRVWSGTRAKAIGLVDGLGTLDDAVKFAAQKAKLKEYEVKSYPKKVSVFEQFFNDMNNDELYAKVIRNKIGEDNFKLFQELTEQEKKGKIIMELPFKINIR